MSLKLTSIFRVAMAVVFVHVGFLSAQTTTFQGNVNANGGSYQINGSPAVQTQGTYNWFFGGAGNSTLTGCCNVGFGGYSLITDTTGAWNVAIGTNSLNQNTTGSVNVAIGGQALQQNTSGQYNTAVGLAALQQNTVGSANTVYGATAMTYLTTGSWNVAFGANALNEVTTDSSNNAFGDNALASLQTGHDNVAVGDGAGDDIPNGSGSTVPFTSGSLNVYLGASTMSLANTDTNEVVIGAKTVGNGSNTVTLGNTSIASTVLRGDIILTDAGSTSSTGASIIFPNGIKQSMPWTGVLNGGDYAESIDVSGERTSYEPGDLLVIDAASPGKFVESTQPYSRLVAGIYSTRPGVRGRRQASDTKNVSSEVPMAMVGIVPTKVSAENGPIRVGDLLVTSSTRGTAMKGSDFNKMIGAVVGKALGNLDSGEGTIEVLVTLQ